MRKKKVGNDKTVLLVYFCYTNFDMPARSNLTINLCSLAAIHKPSRWP